MQRGRRLTLAFKPHPPSPAPSSAAEGSGGSRFSCLGSEYGSSDEESSPAVGIKMALDVLGNGEDHSEWTTVVGRRRKTEAEIVQEFWEDAGFPTPASRFWESRSPSSPVTPSNRAGLAVSPCRIQEDSVVDGEADRPRSSSPAGSAAAAMPSRTTPSSPTGLRMSRPPRMGKWRGPLPPPPVLGQFLAAAKVTSSDGYGASPAPDSLARSADNEETRSVAVQTTADPALPIWRLSVFILQTGA